MQSYIHVHVLITSFKPDRLCTYHWWWGGREMNRIASPSRSGWFSLQFPNSSGSQTLVRGSEMCYRHCSHIWTLAETALLACPGVCACVCVCVCVFVCVCVCVQADRMKSTLNWLWSRTFVITTCTCVISGGRSNNHFTLSHSLRPVRLSCDINVLKHSLMSEQAALH